MIVLADLVRSLAGLLELVVPAKDAAIDDLTLAEPGRDVLGIPGDLTVGVGVDSAVDGAQLVTAAGRRGVPAVLLRAGVAHLPEVRAAARDHGVALVALAENASWAHVIWLLRGLVDRTLGQQGPRASASEELYAIADAAAQLVGGPITIEDAHSRVLAYSSRQDSTAPALVSTIVGRRVPDSVRRHLRARGVFRRMVASPASFFVDGGPDSPVGPRHVVPVHAGGEWLGSIWALVPHEPDPATVAELERTAAVVALHLLQLRSQADLSRRVAQDRLRAVLTGDGADVEAWLPQGPWRVVALTSTDAREEAQEVGRRLDQWEAVLRRQSWPEPRLTSVADRAFALVRDDGAGRPTQKSPAGTWPWLLRVVDALAQQGSSLVAGAGAPALTPSDLPRSLAQAQAVGRVVRAGTAPGPACTVEQAWAPITLDRVGRTIGEGILPTPVDTLVALDQQEGTSHAATLAAWLDHRGSTSDAADALGIHPNTLRHRMGRIVEVLDANLDDADERLALRVQLLALSAADRR